MTKTEASGSAAKTEASGSATERMRSLVLAARTKRSLRIGGQEIVVQTERSSGSAAKKELYRSFHGVVGYNGAVP
jgi:hypothetical protein